MKALQLVEPKHWQLSMPRSGTFSIGQSLSSQRPNRPPFGAAPQAGFTGWSRRHREGCCHHEGTKDTKKAASAPVIVYTTAYCFPTEAGSGSDRTGSAFGAASTGTTVRRLPPGGFHAEMISSGSRERKRPDRPRVQRGIDRNTVRRLPPGGFHTEMISSGSRERKRPDRRHRSFYVKVRLSDEGIATG